MERLGCNHLLSGAQPGRRVALLSAACGAGAVLLLLKRRWHRGERELIANARARRDRSLKSAEEAVEQFKKEHPGTESAVILSLPLEELRRRLREKELSPEAVLYTYTEKALQVTRTVNCATAILPESREQLAQTEQHRDGLLYGVPVSIKDNVGIKGHDSTCGTVQKLEHPEVQDSVVVQVLKKQGAIPFVKTNVPQGLLNYDCSNPIFEQTLNPCNLHKTPGGSSGGEGALIGAGGSILGLGTDIGGSIRIPSSFCGICGFKPTSGRLSARGLASCCYGQKSVLSSVGPMARDTDSLALCMRALLCDHMFALDPTVPPLPFDEQVYASSRPLRVGYYENDGNLMPSPSMSRALRETKVLLEEAGHTLVPFLPPRLDSVLMELGLKGLLADGGTTLLDNLKGGCIDPTLSPQTTVYRMPRLLKRILAVLLKPLYPRMAASFLALNGCRSIPELWKQHKAVQDYHQEFIAEWRKRDLDVLLCPVLGPAYNLGYCGKLTSALSYTAFYNLLNAPAGVVPVSVVSEEDEEELKDYKGNFGDPWDKLFKQAVTGGQGLPVGVQCVALPWQDELCLRFMKEVETLVRNKQDTNKV
uniref:Fatty-acid amide hydrolase 1 n=1 Tax=Lepisosteus oculatus TaxID=7918 RepID=W5M8Y6_LEPOC